MTDFGSKVCLIIAACEWYPRQNEHVKLNVLHSVFWLADFLIPEAEQRAAHPPYVVQELELIKDLIENAIRLPGYPLEIAQVLDSCQRIRSRVADTP